jgi:sec-independent protein translocase protein TatC
MASKPSAVRGARVVGERYLRSKRQGNPDGRMPLMDHLRELRNRVVKALLAIVVGMGVALFFSSRILAFVVRPYCETRIQGVVGCTGHGLTHELIAGAVLDPFNIRIEVAFFSSLIVTCPIWLYQLWAFIAPGLYGREKRWAYLFTGTAAPLFIGGAALAYLVMDRGLSYLLGLTPSGVAPLISYQTYLGYFLGMMIGFGIVFELPLVLVMLNMAGILTHERFRKWRRMLIFLIFLISGIVNPSPDPLTMLVLGGIAVALVEAAELFVYFNDKRRAARNPSPYADLADDELAPVDEPEPVDVDSSLN